MPTLSRLTLTTFGDDKHIEQITKHLNRLVDVVKLVDLTEGAHVERDLMLIKVRADGGQREEIKRTTDIFRGADRGRRPEGVHDSTCRDDGQARFLRGGDSRGRYSRGGSLGRGGDRSR
jgi:hypothetical protein